MKLNFNSKLLFFILKREVQGPKMKVQPLTSHCYADMLQKRGNGRYFSSLLVMLSKTTSFALFTALLSVILRIILQSWIWGYLAPQE